MGSWMLFWILFTADTLRPVFVQGAVSVHFRTGRPLYVARGQTLVLEAVFEKNPDDKIDMVTWDRERGAENVRLSGTQGSRITLEKEDALLRITDVTEVDFATYKVTVTDSNGDQKHDSMEVREMVDPPKASIRRVLECGVDTRGVTQWDKPQFSWRVDGVAVTNQTALLGDGRLDISEVKGVNYTCVISSSLGTVTAHFEIPEESQPCCRGLIVIVVVAGLAVVVFVFVYFACLRRRCQ